MKTNKQKNYKISKEGDAFNIPECPESGTKTLQQLASETQESNGMCLGTPDKYEITIYEMGLCTGNPLSAAGFDKSSCIATMEAKVDGFVADLAGAAAPTNLPNMSGRPANGSYTHAYIILSNQFGMRGEYTVKDSQEDGAGETTYYSTPGKDDDGVYGGTKTTPPAVAFTETLNNMNLIGDSFNAFMPKQAMKDGGNVAALLLKSRDPLEKATDKAAVTSMVGVFEPLAPVVITNATNGLEMQFKVTKGGYAVMLEGGGVGDPLSIGEFGSAPFKPIFETF